MTTRRKDDEKNILPFPTGQDAPPPSPPVANTHAPAQEGERMTVLRKDWDEMIRQRDEALGRLAVLESESLNDHKTGLKNEKALKIDFKTEQERQKRSASKGAVLLAFDLNGLKAVNDKCGHDQGDHLLQKFSALLKNNMRNEFHVYRVSGDEFFVLLEGADESDAYKFIKRTRENCERDRFETRLLKNGERVVFPITFGVGIRTFGQTDHFEDVKKKADIFLIADKKVNGIKRGRLPSAEPK